MADRAEAGVVPALVISSLGDSSLFRISGFGFRIFQSLWRPAVADFTQPNAGAVVQSHEQRRAHTRLLLAKVFGVSVCSICVDQI